MRDFTSALRPIQYFFPLCVGLFSLLMLYEGWAWLTEYVQAVQKRVGYWPTISELSHGHPWLGALIALAIALFLLWWLIHMWTLH